MHHHDHHDPDELGLDDDGPESTEVRARAEAALRSASLHYRSFVLDRVLASRAYVRVVRVLVEQSLRVNLTGRDLARRAGVSTTRTNDILRALENLDLVRVQWSSTHAIYRLNPGHKLADSLRYLFEEEYGSGIDPQPVTARHWHDPWLLR